MVKEQLYWTQQRAEQYLAEMHSRMNMVAEDDREGNKNKFPSALAQLEHQRHTQFENKSGRLSRHRRQGGNYKSKSATWRNNKPNSFSITGT
jgi:hypothetical protein